MNRGSFQIKNCSQNYVYRVLGLGGVNGCIHYLARNNRSKQVNQAIQNSKLNNEKEGVALILSASRFTDHNFAFADSASHLLEIDTLAKRFIIESKTISNVQQLSEAIENVCRNNTKPIKVIVVRGHGTLQSIHLGIGQVMRGDDPNLIAALKKTDASAHIILDSCSTGKLRSGAGTSLADQLSIQLPGRTVTGLSNDAGAILVEKPQAAQGIALLGCIDQGVFDPAKSVPTHSYCVQNDTRKVGIYAALDFFISCKEDWGKGYKDATDQDRKYATATGSLTNKYTFYMVLPSEIEKAIKERISV